MSVRLHEGPQLGVKDNSGAEIRAGYRLADLAKLKSSPVVSLAFDRVRALTEQGKRAIVGISTEQTVVDGADPSICIVLNLSRHGEFGNQYHPERYDFRRVDLVGTSIGDNPLRVRVSGRDSIYREAGMPHKITEMGEIEEALDQALLNPRSESTSIGQDLGEFPVRGFERIAAPEIQ